MAGIASCFPSKPLLTQTLTATPSRLDSKLFGVRLFNIGTIKSSSIFLSSTLGGSCITAQYGGGFRPSGPRNSGQCRKSDSDDDQALDISTIRSATVRLIDEKQNMVGVLYKNEAIQMAEDAELDLDDMQLIMEASPTKVSRSSKQPLHYVLEWSQTWIKRQ